MRNEIASKSKKNKNKSANFAACTQSYCYFLIEYMPTYIITNLSLLKCLSAASATIDLPLTSRYCSGRWTLITWKGMPYIDLCEFFFGFLKSFMYSCANI